MTKKIKDHEFFYKQFYNRSVVNFFFPDITIVYCSLSETFLSNFFRVLSDTGSCSTFFFSVVRDLFLSFCQKYECCNIISLRFSKCTFIVKYVSLSFCALRLHCCYLLTENISNLQSDLSFKELLLIEFIRILQFTIVFLDFYSIFNILLFYSNSYYFIFGIFQTVLKTFTFHIIDFKFSSICSSSCR